MNHFKFYNSIQALQHSVQYEKTDILRFATDLTMQLND